VLTIKAMQMFTNRITSEFTKLNGTMLLLFLYNHKRTYAVPKLVVYSINQAIC